MREAVKRQASADRPHTVAHSGSAARRRAEALDRATSQAPWGANGPCLSPALVTKDGGFLLAKDLRKGRVAMALPPGPVKSIKESEASTCPRLKRPRNQGPRLQQPSPMLQESQGSCLRVRGFRGTRLQAS